MTQVKILVAEDESQPFGHAHIGFPGQLGQTASLRLSISRVSQESPHLGPAGWQARPALIDARVVVRGEASTTVIVGPEVCEQIPVDQQIRIAVDGQDIWGNVFWPAITASMGVWSGELAPPPRVPLQLPVVGAPAPSPPPPPVVPLPPPPPFRTPEPSPLVPPSAPPRNKRSWLPFFLLVLILLAGGGYLFSGKINWPLLAQSESLAARLERLRATDQVGNELLLLSHDAYAGADKSIGQQALLLSVERRHAPAKLELARLYDPRSFDEAKLDGPADANKAGRAYFELSLEGNAEADALLSSLCAESRDTSSRYRDAFDGFMSTTYCEGTLAR